MKLRKISLSFPQMTQGRMRTTGDYLSIKEEEAGNCPGIVPRVNLCTPGHYMADTTI